MAEPFSLGSLLDLGGKDSFLGSLAPIAMLGGLNYLSTSGAARDQRRTEENRQTFTAAEAEKDRAFQQSLFEQKAALEAGLAALNAKMQKLGLLNNAYSNATSTRLQGGAMQMQSLNNMMQGVQRGLAR